MSSHLNENHPDHNYGFHCKVCGWHSHKITAAGFQSEKTQAADHRRTTGHNTKEGKR